MNKFNKIFRIKLVAHLTEGTLSYLKTFLEYHVYFSCSVLDDRPPQKSEEEFNLFRLNQVLTRKYMFKKLKSMHYFNF